MRRHEPLTGLGAKEPIHSLHSAELLQYIFSAGRINYLFLANIIIKQPLPPWPDFPLPGKETPPLGRRYFLS